MESAFDALNRRAWIIVGSGVVCSVVAILLVMDPLGRVLILSGIFAGTFVAYWLSARVFSARQAAALRAVHQALLGRTDVGDDEYASHFSGVDRALALDVRIAVAACFDVPPEKIHPTDDLRRDFKYDDLGTGFEFFVVERVCSERGVEPRPYSMFGADKESGIAAYTAFLSRILTEFETGESAGVA